MRVPISGLIIAQNEEKCIAKAITNIKPNVSEVVIIDGGSTDATVEIATNLGCKVFHRKFDFHFSEQRNFGISKCENDWVLMCDADEWFKENFFDILPTLIITDELKGKAAFHVYRISIFDGEERGADFQWRVLNKHRCHWSGKVHEGLKFNKECKGYKVPPEYCMYHEHSMAKQLWSNALYRNINQDINIRPGTDEGAEFQNGEWIKVKTNRDG